jgi:hypothetical protein
MTPREKIMDILPELSALNGRVADTLTGVDYLARNVQAYQDEHKPQSELSDTDKKVVDDVREGFKAEAAVWAQVLSRLQEAETLLLQHRIKVLVHSAVQRSPS